MNWLLGWWVSSTLGTLFLFILLQVWGAPSFTSSDFNWPKLNKWLRRVILWAFLPGIVTLLLAGFSVEQSCRSAGRLLARAKGAILRWLKWPIRRPDDYETESFKLLGAGPEEKG